MSGGQSCFFCGCSEQSALVLSQWHNIYLCNGRTKGSSHAVYYLKRHPLASFAKNGQRIQCYRCKESNLYLLGYVDGPWNLVCRTCFLQQYTGERLCQEAQKWRPLIQDNGIDTTFVNTPSKTCTITKEELHDKMQSLLPSRPEKSPRPPLQKLEYDERDPQSRISKLIPFVHEELHCSKARTCREIYNISDVTWVDDKNFDFFGGCVNFSPGTQVSVASGFENSNNKGTPGIIVSSMYDLVSVRLISSMPNRPRNVQLNRWFTEIPYKRQLVALDNAMDMKNSFFLEIISGNLGNIMTRVPNPAPLARISKGTLSKLDSGQRQAITHALQHKFSAIQGPPGCGKSTCMVMQAISLAKQGRKVMICTRDNAAADNITKILMTQDKAEPLNLFYLRVVGETYRECVPDEIWEACAHRWTPEEVACWKADILVTTTCSSGGARFRYVESSALIIDEANTLVDPDLLIPLTNFPIEMLTIYGDQKQIGAFTLSMKSRELGYDKPLIQRLDVLGSSESCIPRVHYRVYYRPFMLTTQYRMHPALARFVSREFYQGQLTSGISASDRATNFSHWRWPNPQIPLVFWDVQASKEQRTSDGASLMNVAETAALARLLNVLHKDGIQSNRISVITFYQGQLMFIQEALARMCTAPSEWIRAIETKTVDGYEGRDVDFSIILCVRSNQLADATHRIGFLSDAGRFLVAITRARFGMFVIGNAETLQSDEHWRNFIRECRNERTIVTNI